MVVSWFGLFFIHRLITSEPSGLRAPNIDLSCGQTMRLFMFNSLPLVVLNVEKSSMSIDTSALTTPNTHIRGEWRNALPRILNKLMLIVTIHSLQRDYAQ